VRLRRWLARLALIPVGVLGGLLAAEAVARMRTPEPGEQLYFNTPDMLPRALYRQHPTLLVEPTPGFDETVSNVDYLVRLRIDPHGLRGPEPGSKPEKRWIAVGDSFTIAVQVPEEDTFEALLGKALGVEILNGGVDGYSTWQAGMRWALLDDAVPSDGALLLYFTGNDLGDNLMFLSRSKSWQGDMGRGPKAGAWAGFQRWLGNNSVILAYWRIAEKRAAMESGRDPEGRRFVEEMRIFTRDGRGQIEHMLPQTRAALAAFQKEVARRGDALRVAVAPPFFVVDTAAADRTFKAFNLRDADLDAPTRAVLGVLSELGIPSCDLSPALKAAANAGKKPYLRYDSHWSAEGHAVAAEAMAACWAG
jgi:hypothetical protein